MLTETTVRTVKATAPALAEHGLAITRRMYEILFRNEEIRNLFNQSHHGETGSQPKALAQAVLAYAENIDNLGVLAPAVERIAQKHVALNILPEHYPYVGEALLQAIRDVLGAAATEEVMAAWAEAYGFLADLLIGRERRLYVEIAAAPGGWTGYRAFVVDRVVRESDIIKSFYLKPADGGAIAPYRPGQYLTFKLDIPGYGALVRNYSLSGAYDPAFYRVSIKREPEGLGSGYFHDAVKTGTTLQVSAPAGDFVLDAVPQRPIVLLSGGVGLTPMLSMLETVAAQHPDVPVWYVHGTENGRHHAMRDHVRQIATRNRNVRPVVFYREPAAGDVQGRDYDRTGLITTDWLAETVPQLRDCDFYICGPKPFMKALVSGLRLRGVSPDRIRFEFFGPADELFEAA